MIGGIVVQHLDQLTKLKSVALIWLIGSAVTDLMITAILVIHLVDSYRSLSKISAD
jgi:hypothetical protein